LGEAELEVSDIVWFGNGTEVRYKLYPEPLADVLKLDLCGVRLETLICAGQMWSM